MLCFSVLSFKYGLENFNLLALLCKDDFSCQEFKGHSRPPLPLDKYDLAKEVFSLQALVSQFAELVLYEH